MSTANSRKTWFGHPVSLFSLFSSEMWERFSFYTMRNILTLYMVHFLMYGDSKSARLYGVYNTLVYITPLIGGYIADRILGYNRSIIFGGVVMAIGQFCLSVPIDHSLLSQPVTLLGIMQMPREYTFYTGLCFLIVGNGFFKPNISSIVGHLYTSKDPRRDNAYSIFYLGINLGSLFSSLVCGYLQEAYGWNWTFLLAGAGMIIGLVIFAFAQKRLGGIGKRPDATNAAAKRQELLVYVLSLISVPVLFLSFSYYKFMDYVMIATAAIFVGYMVKVIVQLNDKAASRKLVAALLLMFMSVLFFSFFEQAGTSLQLFTDRNLQHTIMGITLPSATINNLFNPLFVVLLSLPFSYLWTLLKRKGLDPSAPMKFAIGIFLVGVGFYTFVWGGRYAQMGLVPMWFLIGGYLFHTLGELCLSPVGLATISKLSPPRMIGLMFGGWFLASACGQYLAAVLSTVASVSDSGTAQVPPAESLKIYLAVFSQIGNIALVAGVVLAIAAPFIAKLMKDDNGLTKTNDTPGGAVTNGPVLLVQE